MFLYLSEAIKDNKTKNLKKKPNKLKGFYLIEDSKDEKLINEIINNGCHCRKINGCSHLGINIEFIS